MNLEDLTQLKKMLVDLRFIQATALVACDMSNDKGARAYIREITRLETILANEIKDRMLP